MNSNLCRSLAFSSLVFFFLTFLTSNCFARIVYVSPDGIQDGTGASWETAFNTITAGLTASASGDEIWVRSATYTEAIEMREGVALYGGFEGNETDRTSRDWTAHETIIDATGLNQSVVKCSNISTAILNGFTLTRGNADDSGGGIRCTYSSPVLKNCIISNNQTFIKGGGVYCSASRPILIDCKIFNNSCVFEGGGIFGQESDISLTNCIISDNLAREGGGVYCHFNSSLILNQCIVESNSSLQYSGGGIYIDYTDLIINNSSIVSNEAAEWGGALLCTDWSDADITNCIIADNTAGFDGSVLYCYDSTSTITNCTITGNRSDKNNGICCYESALTVTNSILYNQGNEFAGDSLDKINATYCCIQNGWEGIGNIATIPDLAQIWSGDAIDVHLLSGSPCIDAGTAVPGIQTDFEGDPRPSGGGWDIGADECIGDCTPGDPTPVGRIWHVSAGVGGGDGSSWESPLSSISAAQKWASLHDEVWVSQGTYSESILLEPNISIFGGFTGEESIRAQRDWKTHQTIINASGLNCSTIQCINLSSATLDGFIITGGSNKKYGGGVECYNATPTLINCTITGNTAENGGGIYCHDISSPTIVNCIIKDNIATGYGGGLNCRFNSKPILNNCIINHNSADTGGGLSSQFFAHLILNNCTIIGNKSTEGAGLYCSSSLLTATNCILWNSGTEISVDSLDYITISYCAVQGGWEGEGNIATDPYLVEMWQKDSLDIHLLSGSPCINAGTQIPGLHTDFEGDPRPSNGGWDIGADECIGDCTPGDPIPTGRIWHVSAGSAGGDGNSWETSLGSISEALERATMLDEVWVVGATYEETIAMENGVGLYGGFAGNETSRNQRNWATQKTIIDAASFNSNVIHCVNLSSATIDGFSLTGGRSFYGGVYCENASPEFVNCIISENISDYGGGILCRKYSSPVFVKCTIKNNKANRFGGGLHCSGYSKPILRSCIVSNNIATISGGGLLCAGNSAPTLLNCLIYGNSSNDSGAALYFDSSSAKLINSTITNNITFEKGSSIDCWSESAPVFKNCILWNGGNEIVSDATEDVYTTFCTVQGGWPGEGNIDSDPLFVKPWDGTSADLRLRPSSPCIDAGTSIPDLATDLAGHPRPVDIPGMGIEGPGAFDIGAYERQLLDVGDVRGAALLRYSILWQRGEEAIPPAMNETEFQIYNTWVDETIDWKDIITTLEIGQ